MFSLTLVVQVVTDLPYLTTILEYLCREVNNEILYEKPLFALLKILQNPPIIHSASQSEEYEAELSDYFTGLGNCIEMFTFKQLPVSRNVYNLNLF